MSRKLSFSQTLKNDYWAFVMSSSVVISWGLVFFASVLGVSFRRRGQVVVDHDPIKTMIAIVIAITVTALFGWLATKRLRMIRRSVTSGSRVIGTVTSIWFYKDRGRIEFKYEYFGKCYQTGTAILKNKVTTQFNEGSEILLIVDSKEPTRAFAEAFYISPVLRSGVNEEHF